MTRRIAGPSQTTGTRTPYVLPIGHLSTKSSVYSPVSMSRMSQDLVYNHMKSHYQRISSAKACVDTTAPKSMKLTIKEKDRKRKEALLASNTQRTSSRFSSRQSNYHTTEASNSPRDHDINNNPRLNDISTNDTMTSSRLQTRNQRPISRKSSRSQRENGDYKQTHYNQRLKEQAMLANQGPFNDEDHLRENNDSYRHNKHSDQYNYERFERRKIDHKGNLENSSRMRNNENGKSSEPNITDTKDFHVNDDCLRHVDEYNHERYQRTNHRTDQTPNTENSTRKQINETIQTSESNIADTSNLRTSSQRKEWSDLRNKTLENGLEEHRDRFYTSTPRFEREDEFDANPNLSTMTFSYKSSPTRRKPRKKNPEEIIWTEEQKYLQFISDVTSDVLARGICSNRVINKVFESHIEKRKDDLDEENMREMINQLKEDLGVTND